MEKETRNTIKVVGLFVEKYIDADVSGHNGDFEYVPMETEKYHLLVTKPLPRGNRNARYVITVWTDYGECGSGWCTASFGHMEVKRVDHFGPFTHRPKQPLYIDGDIMSHDGVYELVTEENDEYDEYSVCTDVFKYSPDGGDEYYPRGGASVNLDLFEELPRAMSARPVWILKGASGLGKSTLGESLTAGGQTVFETDSVDELPDVITESVVVLGNRSGFTVDDVKSRLFGTPKVILVDFAENQ